MIRSAMVWVPVGMATADLLRPVAGVPLLLRTLLTAQRAGVRELWLVGQESCAQLRPRVLQDRRLQARVIWVADQPWPALVKAVPELEKRWGEADLWVIPADAVIDPALLREMADRPTSRPVAAIGEWPTASTRKGTGVLRVDGRWLRGLLSASGDRELSAVLADVASGSDVEEISNHARLCLPSLAQADGRRVERLLCAGWQSSSDGWVDRYLNRKVSAVWTRWLLKTPLTPNHVTLISLAVGLLAALSFAQVGWVSGVVGALLLQCSAIIDCCDGEIARLKFQESPGGYYLDIACDNAVHVAVFVAIAWSSYRATGGNHILVLGGLAAFGTLASFVIVLATRHGRGRQTMRLLDRVIDALTNRDFSVILLLGALVGRLEWFLWGLAVGVNVFWPTALGLAWKARRVAHG